MSQKTVLMTAIPMLGFEDPVLMFVAASDVDARGGLGSVMLTNDPQNALHFDTAADALECWRKQSTAMPLRPDSKPNRPLTAFTVSLQNVEVEDEAARN